MLVNTCQLGPQCPSASVTWPNSDTCYIEAEVKRMMKHACSYTTQALSCHEGHDVLGPTNLGRLQHDVSMA